MKRTMIFMVCFMLMLVMISSGVLAAEQDAKAAYDFETAETVIHTDIFEGEETVFPVMPEAFNKYPTEHKGTVERLYYETDVYEDGETHRKYCTVYLPYGYDPDDTETKYNVFYYQHGNSNTPNDFWDRSSEMFNPTQMMDNLFDPDHRILEPFIMICPTYYFDVKKKTKFIADASGPAGDGSYEGIPGNYYRELIEDLIPQVESQYNVYCEDFSPEGIKATRDHRAFGGFSRGSMCTWDILHYDLEYFKYFMPMSGGIIPDRGSQEDRAPEEAYQYIHEAIEAEPDLEYFIFAVSGGEEDGPGQSMIPQMQEFMQHQDVFSYGTDPSVNNYYFTLSEFGHMDMVVPYYFYAAKDVLFR